jgi:hypothetical protein
MSERARKHLPLAGLFTAYVDADFLGGFMQFGEQDSSAYAELLGETPDAGEWETVLEEAARCGLLRSMGSRVYQLHPTLPVFLRRQLAEATGADGLTRLDAVFLDLAIKHRSSQSSARPASRRKEREMAQGSNHCPDARRVLRSHQPRR